MESKSRTPSAEVESPAYVVDFPEE